MNLPQRQPTPPYQLRRPNRGHREEIGRGSTQMGTDIINLRDTRHYGNSLAIISQNSSDFSTNIPVSLFNK